MTDVHSSNKAVVAPLRAALYDFDAEEVRRVLVELLLPDSVVHMGHPFCDLTGPEEFYGTCFAPLFDALPDLERRDQIVVAGPDGHENDWVGCCGYYTGTFVAPFVEIPPTGHQVHMRFHEFFRLVDGKVVEIQALWDIPELMMQAGAWPMAPSLGREWNVPGPATQDGIVAGPRDAVQSEASCRLIVDMLEHMILHPAQGGPDVMQLERFWHEKTNWYGPAGIGTGRGIAGFRNWHQIPFLRAMPDRGQREEDVTHHFFGDANYAAVTGWPNMIQTVSDDGWMGIAPAGRRIAMRSLDFWRIEKGKIRENWVLVDILDAYRQLGVDVLARVREFNKARVPGRVPFPVGVP